MWIDQQGVSHTAALPEPSRLMTDEFRAGLDQLLASHRVEVQDLLEEVTASMYRHLSPSNDEAAFEGVAAPRELLRGTASTVQELRINLERMVPCWRPDAVLALDDYLDCGF